MEKHLLPSAYCGRNNETSFQAKDLHTYASLEELIQASPIEIAAECARLGCMELGGRQTEDDCLAMMMCRLHPPRG